ncbi:MAG: hypothetical protein ABWW69_02385 [Pyrodictiaceae archaeon]
MRIIVDKPERIKGSVEAPPSLFLSLYGIALIGLLGGEVEGVDVAATPIRLFVSALRRIGLDVEAYGDRVVVGSSPPAEVPRRILLDIGCSGLLAYTLPLVAWARARPGTTIVLRSHCPWLTSINVHGLVSALSALGARIWPGESASRLIVIEAHGKPLRPTATMITLPAGSNGLIASTLLLALAASRGGVLRYQPGLKLHSRLMATARLVEEAGIHVTVREGLVEVKGLGGAEARVKTPRGFMEAGLILAAAGVEGEVVVRGLPRELAGEEDIVEFLHAAGLEVEQGRGIIKAVGSEPRSLIANLSNYPHLSIPLIAYSLASRASFTLTGLAALSEEGIDLGRHGRLLSASGMEADYEDGRLSIKGVREPRTRIDCSQQPQELCTAILVGLAASASRRIVLEDIDPNAISSRILENLQLLGARVREKT